MRGKTPSILQSLSPNTEEGIIDSFLDFVSVLQEAGLTKDALDEMVRWRDIMYFCERYNNEKNPVKKLPCTKAELIGILRRFDDKIIKPRLETFIRKITEVMYPDAAKVVKNVAKKVEKGITPTPDKPLTSVTAHISKDDIRLRIATMRQILERDAYFLFPKRTSLEAFLDGNNPEIDTESLIFLLDLKDSPSEEDMTVWEGITSNDALRSLSDK